MVGDLEPDFDQIKRVANDNASCSAYVTGPEVRGPVGIELSEDIVPDVVKNQCSWLRMINLQIMKER